MPDQVNVVPQELRQAAAMHRDTAEYLGTVPANNAAVMATLESLGPVFAELREAGSDLLEQRRVCYEKQAVAHTELADRLSYAADSWEQQDADAADVLRAVSGVGT